MEDLDHLDAVLGGLHVGVRIMVRGRYYRDTWMPCGVTSITGTKVVARSDGGSAYVVDSTQEGIEWKWMTSTPVLRGRRVLERK